MIVEIFIIKSEQVLLDDKCHMNRNKLHEWLPPALLMIEARLQFFLQQQKQQTRHQKYNQNQIKL